MSRRAGVTIPLFSLRAGGAGVGEIPDLVPFAAWARDAGFSVIQILPVHTPAGGQDSPYSACTAFALDEAYLRVDGAGGDTPGGVDWNAVRARKRAAINRAFARSREQGSIGSIVSEQQDFAGEQAHWLDDYALFMALHEEHGHVSWTDWPAPLRDRDPDALRDAARRHAAAIERTTWVQGQLDRQWHDARARMEAMGVELMGDLPFMVAGDSADVWARAGDFRIDARVGVPPDAFSVDGQDWGLPVFRWDVMAGNDFAWMRARAHRAAELYRWCRVDHVVGLYRTFFRPGTLPAVGAGHFTPADEPEQTRLGERNLNIFSAQLRVVAEDLGIVPDFVRASLRRLAVPGYRVLRWEKDDHLFRDPATWPACSVATTGTHDTESLAEWFDALPAHERAALRRVPGLANLPGGLPDAFDGRVRDALLETVYGSPSDLALIPFPDVFGARDRVNVPGTIGGGNWTYRMPMDLDGLLADRSTQERLRDLARRTGRA